MQEGIDRVRLHPGLAELGRAAEEIGLDRGLSERHGGSSCASCTMNRSCARAGLPGSTPPGQPSRQTEKDTTLLGI